jgi:NAD(P)-dependent dehydrogenase (short-subunit alcohol dehydrogenase family)
VVNFASPAAVRAPASLAAYSAAKAGVVALTQALAAEEKKSGVRVNAIAPGNMDTEQNIAESGPGPGFVSRSAVGDVVLFLVSSAGRGVSGQVLQVTVAGTD